MPEAIGGSSWQGSCPQPFLIHSESPLLDRSHRLPYHVLGVHLRTGGASYERCFLPHRQPLTDPTSFVVSQAQAQAQSETFCDPTPPRELSSVFQLSSLPLLIIFFPEDQLEPPGKWEMCLVPAGLALSSCTRAWSPLRNHIPGETCSFHGIDLPNTAFNSSVKQALLRLNEQPSSCDPIQRSLAALPDALFPEAPWFLILILFQVLSSGLCFLHLRLVISSPRQTQTTQRKCTKMLFKPSQALVWRCPGAPQEP